MPFPAYQTQVQARKPDARPFRRLSIQSPRKPTHLDQQGVRFTLFRCLLLVEYLKRVLPYVQRDNPKKWMVLVSGVRSLWRRQVRRWEEHGLLTPSRAEQLLTCNTPGENHNRHCRYVGCPWCWFRRHLYLARIIWHHAVQPALHARREAPKRKKPKARLALGEVEITVPLPKGHADAGILERRVAQLLDGDRCVQKAQRAGGIRDGVAFVDVFPRQQTSGDVEYVIRVAVLGMTDDAVHLDQPQPRFDRGWRIKWTAGVQKRWHNVPQFGPRTLLGMLAKAFPYRAQFLVDLPPEVFEPVLQLRRKRVQPLGAWRAFIKARPSEFPPPIKYPLSCASAATAGEHARFGVKKQVYFNDYVSKQILKHLDFTPPMIKWFRNDVGVEREWGEGVQFLHPRDVAEELSLPVSFFACRDYDVELDGGFPDQAWLEENPLDDMILGDEDNPGRTSGACRALWHKYSSVVPRKLPRECRWRHVELGIPFRPQLAVAFRPAWSRNIMVLHNYEPALEQQYVTRHPVQQLRTESGNLLLLQKLSDMLSVFRAELRAKPEYDYLWPWYGRIA